MPELSRALFLLGAVPLLVLGAAHAVLTPLRISDQRGLSPSDPDLARRMQEVRVRLTGRTNMWLAWVGFNLSHALGVLVFGAVVVMLGWDAAAFSQHARTGVPLAVVVASLYLYLGTQYWFRTPILGCALSVACFVASWLAL